MAEVMPAPVKARHLLAEFFAIQRVVLGGNHFDAAMLEREGWTLDHQQRLTLFLAHGCHNLAEIAAGLWGGHQPADEAVLAKALAYECHWLWEHAERLQYPAAWDEDDMVIRCWDRFWARVAEVVGRPIRRGVAFRAAPKTRRQLFEQLRRGLDELNIPCWRPWWMRLLRIDGYHLLPPPKDAEGQAG